MATATSATLDPPWVPPDLSRPPKPSSGPFRPTATPPGPSPDPRTAPWTLALLLAWLSGRPSSPTAHHWSHNFSSYGPNLFADPPSRRRRRLHSPRHRRLWFRPLSNGGCISKVSAFPPPRTRAHGQGTTASFRTKPPQAVPSAQPAQPALRATMGLRSLSAPSSSPPRPHTPGPAVAPNNGLPIPASARRLPQSPVSPSLLLPAFADGDPHLLSCVEHFTHTDWVGQKRRAPLRRCHTLHFLALPASPAARPPGFIPAVAMSVASRRACPRMKNQLHRTNDNTVLLVRQPLKPHRIGTIRTSSAPPPRASTFRC